MGPAARLGHASGAAGSTATPSRAALEHWASAGEGQDIGRERPEPTRGDSVKIANSHRPAAARTGWMIQIGATDDSSKATALIARAKSEGRQNAESAQPFTEKVQKGSATLYRARFAGLQADSAELACKSSETFRFFLFRNKRLKIAGRKRAASLSRPFALSNPLDLY